MLKNLTDLNGFAIHATDGDIGTVDEFFFDDETWAIRYLTVETGGWLGGKRVLISPYSITHTDWKARRLNVSLTRKQVEHSPDIDTHQPVSRQHEAEYLSYYGYPYYWTGPYMWGPGFYPLGMPVLEPTAAGVTAARVRKESQDAHLRSSAGVKGYHIAASDGEIGHLESYIVEDRTWVIRYIEVATRNWWPGKKVLVSPAWIDRVSWEEAKVFTGLSREAIQSAPEYTDEMRIGRAFEDKLHSHYGRPPYWLQDEEQIAAGV